MSRAGHAARGHVPRKRFGQNFLHDPGVIQRIVDTVRARPGERLVEIGPGQGAITLPLLRAAGSLDVIELDRDLIAPLQARCDGVGALHIHSADALKFDFATLGAGPHGLRVVGNLPYNISTPLLFHLLEQLPLIADMHFMLQKEVVERMAAHPGDDAYGRLSVSIQLLCEVHALFTIGPGAFRPAPRVESAFVRLLPRPAPLARIDDADTFATVVAQAFGQRRKTLRNSLRALLSVEQIAECGIDPGTRPERLTIEQFAALANRASGAATAHRP